MLGILHRVKDTPTKMGMSSVLEDSRPKQYVKGMDPGSYFQALDYDISRNDFEAVRIEGTVNQVKIYIGEMMNPWIWAAYKGDNPLLWPPSANYIEDLLSLSSVPQPDGKVGDFCLTSALGKLADPQQDYAIPLAELRETAKFLVSPVKSLLRLNAKRDLLNSVWAHTRRGGIRFVSHPDKSIADRLRRKSWAKDLREAPSHIGDFWLSYRYGLEPLVRDCAGVLEHAWHGIGHTRGVFSKRARVVEETTGTFDGAVSLDPGITLNYRDVYKTRSQTRAHVIAKRRVMGGYWTEMLDMGFNPFSAPLIAWELTPLSFVLDRFVNVGDWLQSHTYRPDTVYIGNSVSRHVTVDFNRIQRSMLMGGVTQNNVGPVTWKYDSYVRKANWAIPAWPVFNPRNLRIPQILDHLAISWQRMPKFLKGV
jgi:hypothetical protein